MARKDIGDIDCGRLTPQQLADNFSDISPRMDRQNALLAAARCLYCYDAPCIQACPTGIDIPSFIKRISTDNLRGAATDILSANIMGGMCARVCPTEILCEGACVRNHDAKEPVAIGALQRYATDWVFETRTALFHRAAETGQRVVVVGAGPAGLACAHALARAGHSVTVLDANDKPGGLNEYGIAAYKVPGFPQREVDWLLSIGGIQVHSGVALGRNLTLAQLRTEYDAVFLAIGLGGVNALQVEGEQLPGVFDAVAFIAALRQAGELTAVPVGRRVVVIGGGNTAIDAAVQSKKLGAESVTMVYRRGPETMSATHVEQEFAKEQGVNLIHWAAPLRVLAKDGIAAAVEFEYTRMNAEGRLEGSGDRFTLEADTVLKAIGQTLIPAPMQDGGNDVLAISKGKLVVDHHYRTSITGVWAGGDCAAGNKLDLTVQAVEDGKRAATDIDAYLRNNSAQREDAKDAKNAKGAMRDSSGLA